MGIIINLNLFCCFIYNYSVSVTDLKSTGTVLVNKSHNFFYCFGCGFFPDPDQTFFSEPGSGSVKNPDPDP